MKKTLLVALTLLLIKDANAQEAVTAGIRTGATHWFSTRGVPQDPSHPHQAADTKWDKTFFARYSVKGFLLK